ncbi:MAG TPA: hydroxysqualene dehydroxylase HpnE [Actinomycetales bacterium]|nr:hydroxysqualene dehydroxylase HpnE [Actinomycetales bacterium]
MTTSASSRGQARAVVIGGGLAGISAALALADGGWRTTLLEARPRLGGATYSFSRHGRLVDTGQHVLLRCYTAHRALLERLGVSEDVPVQPRFAVPVLRLGHAPVWLRRGRLGPAPSHLLPALLGYRLLSPADRLSACRAALALRRVGPEDPASDRRTFGDWLAAHGQSVDAIEALWRLICLPALNLEPAEASLALAAKVFRTALLDDVTAADIAVPQVPLGRLYDEPARRALSRAGVRVRTGCRVLTVAGDDSAPLVRTSDGDLTPDAVVVAVPHQQAARMLPDSASPDRDRWAALQASPIVNVHVRYDRPVTTLPFAAGVRTPVQWVFDRTTATGGPGQYLVVSLSGAGHEVACRSTDLLARYVTALAELFPVARDARVLDAFVTREPRATFRQGVGTAVIRPATRTRWPTVVLAGAWTATGYPDTTEGAVRSGLAAAEVLGLPRSMASPHESREVLA